MLAAARAESEGAIDQSALFGSAATGAPVEHFIGVGAWEYDLIYRRLTWTPGLYDLFGLPRGFPLDRETVAQMYEPQSRQRMETLRAHIIRHGGAFTMDAQIWTARGAQRWIRLTAGVIMERGQAIRLFGTKQDISHERAALERLRERAEYDSLTGLPNRGAFEARWRDLASGRLPDVTALGLIDLDHFKRINDGWGHEAGDECLRVTADRLRRSFSGLAFLARYGGDEFALLWRGRIDRTFLQWRFGRAENALSQPVPWEGQFIPISVSIGLALREVDGACGDLFRRADQALYRAKAAGRSATVIDGVSPRP
ncbi:diguanylate cyclase [Acidisoma sp. 7E03]